MQPMPNSEDAQSQSQNRRELRRQRARRAQVVGSKLPPKVSEGQSWLCVFGCGDGRLKSGIGENVHSRELRLGGFREYWISSLDSRPGRGSPWGRAPRNGARTSSRVRVSTDLRRFIVTPPRRSNRRKNDTISHDRPTSSRLAESSRILET